MVDFVRVLSLLPVLLVRLILQHFDAFPAARLVLAGLGDGVQLPHLILEETGRGPGGGEGGERSEEEGGLLDQPNDI